MTVIEKQECRACGNRFSGEVLLDLGDQFVVDFLEAAQVGLRGRAPLQLVRCEVCTLLQLKHTVDQDTLYKKFWYRSSINPQMRSALTDVVTSVLRREALLDHNFVCDIGSNDGELLTNYPRNVFKVGFEPAVLLALEAMGRFREMKDENWQIIPSYFNSIEAQMAIGVGNKYRIITACAMFYDLDNPKEFLHDVKSVLAEDGIFVVQMNYLGTMIRNTAFDNIGHEHLCYYSLTSLSKLFDSVGMEIFDVEFNDVNGGSLRVYAGHKSGHYINDVVTTALMQENRMLTVAHFAERVNSVVKLLRHFLIGMKEHGKKVFAYGASTRGSTLLQTVFGDDMRPEDYLVAAAERDSHKIGKVMAGLNIPIVEEAVARKAADYMLVLPWHFWRSIAEREWGWMERGGKFLLPLPYPKVVQVEEDFGLVAVDLEMELETVRR